MSTYDAKTARCDVFTFKEGLLSAVGHDVKLTVEKFTIEADGGRITATFDPASLAVVCAMKDGVENPKALSDKDRKTIEGYVREDVLHARRYPRIGFATTDLQVEDDGCTFEGRLDLHGRSQIVRGRATLRGEEWVTRIRLHQPDFGIAPFRAMLGTLRIQADVEVEVRLPRSAVTAPG